MRHRILGLWTLFVLMVAVLAGRLFLLTVYPDAPDHPARWQDKTRVRAQMEHLHGQLTDDGRGRILFRNGQPATGAVRHQTLQTMEGVVPYTLHTERTTGREVESSVPSASNKALAVTGEVGLPDDWPTADSVVPEQGRSGLEARFDPLLRGRRPGYIGVLQDVHGSRSEGTVFTIASHPGPDLQTTLDAGWQDAADRALSTSGIPLGSVVILNVRDNQALAIANQSPQAWSIPAVAPAIPGSVMKLVTAAAAFDSYRLGPDAKFICNGLSELPGVHMHCWTVHGHETLTQAIARSCDVALALVGTKVHRQGLQVTWDRLHLGTPNLQTVKGRPVLLEARGGTLFKRSGHDNGLLANTAIGQEDVRMTPLQAANMASTIANGGLYRDVQLVLNTQVHHQVVRRFDAGARAVAMLPFTAHKLKLAMREAVTDPRGTAHYLDGLKVPVAVKTGTAELPDGRVNGWMVGFAPIDHPEIAFSIYTGDLPEAQAHAAVTHIATAVLQTYRQFPSHPVIG